MSLLAKRVAEVAKQSPTAISLPKSALLGYSSEILVKTSLAFCLLFFLSLLSTRENEAHKNLFYG